MWVTYLLLWHGLPWHGAGHWCDAMSLRRVWRKVAGAYFGCGIAWAITRNVLLYRNGAPSMVSVTADADGAIMLWATVVAPVLFWPVYVVGMVVVWVRMVVGRATGS